MTERIPVSTKYGLQRDNFILDPIEDTECFARVDIDTRSIAESLDTDLVTGIAPKRRIWGPYGGGKTHTLMRTMKELGQLTDVYSVRVECPDLSKKSRFHDLYREGIMRELGEDFVVGLIDEVIRNVLPGKRREELVEGLKEELGDEEIAKAAVRIIDPNFEQLRLWRWISGAALSRADLDDLGQTQDLTATEAARLADIICLFGRLLKQYRGQTLVLVLDEMERLRQIGAETIPTFMSGFTRLADPNQTDVSVLMGASAQVEAELVEVFAAESPVISRLGSEATLEIRALDPDDVDRFIKDVIAYVRDPEADLAALMEAAEATTSETIDPEFFPLTEDAVEALKSNLQQIMTPREITLKMTRALGRAFRADSPAATTDHIK
jgi:hypothetical protein